MNDYIEYKIRPGDTLKRLADYFGTTEEEIKQVNNLTSDELKINQVLRIPFIIPLIYYEIKEGDSLYKIAQEKQITAEELAYLNGMKVTDFLYKGEKIIVPKDIYGIYITKSGDSLEYVLNKFSISARNILTHNKYIYLLPDQLIVFDNENKI